MDLITNYGELPFPIDTYTNVSTFMDMLNSEECPPVGIEKGEKKNEIMKESRFNEKYKGLNKKLMEAIDDYGLVGFTMLNIMDKESMLHLLQIIDKANGCIFKEILGNEGATSAVNKNIQSEQYENVYLVLNIYIYIYRKP